MEYKFPKLSLNFTYVTWQISTYGFHKAAAVQVGLYRLIYQTTSYLAIVVTPLAQWLEAWPCV